MRGTKSEHRRRTRPHFRSGEEGQALVELALTVPLLILLLLGAAELARVAYTAIELTSAAKAGAQYAAQGPGYLSNQNGMITAAAQADAPYLTGMTVTPTTGSSCSDGSQPTQDSSTGSYSCSTGTQIPAITVTTSVSFDPLIHLPFLPQTFTMTGYAFQQCVDCQ